MNGDPPGIFVDANILIYAHDQSAGDKQRQASAALRSLWADRAGCLSIQVLQEFFVNITRKVPRPLDARQASDAIDALATWRVHSPNVDDIQSAIRMQERYGLSFWDAMVITSAAALGCRILWSEDLNPGQHYGEVQVVNPLLAPAADPGAAG